MSSRRRTACGAFAAVLLCVTTLEPTRGFSFLPNKWPNGSVTMQLQLQLGSAPATLIDGATSFNQVAASAMSTWNNHTDLVTFNAVDNSTMPRVENDGFNSVFFDSSEFGRRLDGNTLAIATSWYQVSTGNKLEGDLVFNNTVSWNSYRGGLRASHDFNRVALHEFGHILGLDHPDQNGQRVTALMNSEITNLDSLTADDIAGARALYGAGVAPDISLPPRHESNDSFNQLIDGYRDELRAGQVTTHLDHEGLQAWVLEYLRYRLNSCSHGDATTRVLMQIRGQGIQPVCR